MGCEILVVDDDPAIRELMRTMLEVCDAQVDVATSGSEALVRMAQHPSCRVLLTDIEMPGMDGREVARRAYEMNPSLEIVAMSGGGMELADLGPPFRRLLPKPVSLEALRGLVERGRAHEPSQAAQA